jgi:acetyl-CoA C-acetyltransferase
MISVKSHYNGARNPKAHLRREITLDQALNAPMIAWPLGLYDCCGVTDGAAAAILCRAEDAKKFRKDYITVKGLGNAAGPGCGKMMTTYDWVHWEETYRATLQTYQQAGIKNPRKEIDIVECHDCFSIAELMCYESMGFCERGKAKYDIEAGTFALDGEVAFNAGGGLKSFGHPVGASGVREVYEIYKQIQGKAQEPSRQIKNVQLGIAHNQGGHPGTFMCSMGIFGVPGR